MRRRIRQRDARKLAHLDYPHQRIHPLQRQPSVNKPNRQRNERRRPHQHQPQPILSRRSPPSNLPKYPSQAPNAHRYCANRLFSHCAPRLCFNIIHRKRPKPPRSKQPRRMNVVCQPSPARLVLRFKLINQSPIRPSPRHHRKVADSTGKLDFAQRDHLRSSPQLLKRSLQRIERQPKMPRQSIRAPHRHNPDRRHRRTRQPLHYLMHGPIAAAGKYHICACLRSGPRLRASRPRSLGPDRLNRMPQTSQRLRDASNCLVAANPAAARRRIEDQHQSHAPILRASWNRRVHPNSESIQQTMVRQTGTRFRFGIG